MTEAEIRAWMARDRTQGERVLFDAYYPYVYAIAVRRIAGIGTREDVEECVIDVFLEVLQRFDTIQEGSLQAYIGTAARHKASNICRYVSAKSRRTESLADMEREPADPQDVAQATETAMLTDRLLQGIASLGEPDATIIIQKFYYDRKAKEIGALFGKSPAWVRNRCARALKRLRTLLADVQ